ncbi:MAG: lactate racemase domain-containing protein [Myxococcota bacterium]
MARNRRNVVILDEDSPPRIFHYGEDFISAKLPAGTRCLYSNPPMKPIENRGAAIRYALNHPEGDVDPLFAQLEPGMKVTIAIDDISVPLPPMKTPDIRQEILEILIQMFKDYGVEDFEMFFALALHRRMTESEIKRCVGSDIFNEYYPDRLYNMDAEDPDEMKFIGETDQGEEVEIVRRAADSDLLIYVNVNFVPMNGGYKSIGTGMSGYKSIRHHHNPETILDSDSYMDPENSALYDSNTRIGMMLNEELNIFHIETALNNKMYDDQLDFMARPEEDWTGADHLKFKSLQYALQKAPRSAKRTLFHKIPADYGLIGCFAGETEAVHDKTLEKCWQQHAIEVDGQSDIVMYGIPFESPYNVNSIMNPLLVRVMALGYFFNMYRGKPLIKKDGTLIITHPCYDDFDADHHPSYIEFFNRCLPETRDSHKLAHKYEEEFANNPSYIEMFRRGNAYHGVHPFYMWYWCENGQDHIGRVIVVGAENEHVPERLGWERADTIDEALDMARETHGPDPSISMMHHPPFAVADVK